jgi:hypothetical protein
MESRPAAPSVFGAFGCTPSPNRRRDAQGVVAFVALTLLVFFLWSAWLEPAVVSERAATLLNFPNKKRGDLPVCSA